VTINTFRCRIGGEQFLGRRESVDGGMAAHETDLIPARFRNVETQAVSINSTSIAWRIEPGAGDNDEALAARLRNVIDPHDGQFPSWGEASRSRSLAGALALRRAARPDRRH